MQISNAGTYRGRIMEHSVSETKNGFPQLVARLGATEYYDRDYTDGTTDESGREVKGAWVGLGEELEILGYFCLVDGKGEKTLNCQQVEKTLGWDGCDLMSLNDMPLTDKAVQFRVKEHEYEQKITLQAEWLDEFEANPNPGLKKLDAESVKTLQSKFAKAFSNKKPVAAATAKPATKPVILGAARPTTKAPPVSGQAPTASTVPTSTVPTPAAPKRGRPAGSGTKDPIIKAPAVPVRQPTQPKVETISTCTKEEAFEFVGDQQLWKEGITEEKLAEVWIAAVTEIAGERSDEELTSEEWFTIREKVAKEIFVF